MSHSALAERVRTGDPDRYLASRAVPPRWREDLLTLYALNLEIARVPLLASQPLIAEMRLQWWRDVLDDPAPRADELAGPLQALILRVALPPALLDQMITARRWDVYTEPFTGPQDFASYIAQTSGNLMWAAALVLGAGTAEESYIRNAAQVSGIANFLRAVPGLQARGRRPLADGSDGEIRALAQSGLDALADARKVRPSPAAALAVLPGWQAGAVLRAAMRDPGRVRTGALELPEVTRRARLAFQGITGRL